MTRVVRTCSVPEYPARNTLVNHTTTKVFKWLASLFPQCWRCCHMREVAGSTPGLDFYLLCEPIYVSLHFYL
jgi:hypothetical protein